MLNDEWHSELVKLTAKFCAAIQFGPNTGYRGNTDVK